MRDFLMEFFGICKYEPAQLHVGMTSTHKILRDGCTWFLDPVIRLPLGQIAEQPLRLQLRTNEYSVKGPLNDKSYLEQGTVLSHLSFSLGEREYDQSIFQR